ncbi:MAG TPA: cytochrome c-type biogenesis protein [Solirubrobacterales bacterium]|nr:cytochrome c-type biogenesis protein [Solirubrobacterales bacterium]
MLRASQAFGLALTTLAIFATAGLAQTTEPQTTLPDVEDEVMCPVCGTTLELASDSPQAIDERELIRDLIAEGKSKEDIKDELVSEFGSEVLATPSTEGFDLAAWVVPGLAVMAGGVAAFVGLRRWRGATVAQRETDGPVPSESAEDRERLDDELERYDV